MTVDCAVEGVEVFVGAWNRFKECKAGVFDCAGSVAATVVYLKSSQHNHCCANWRGVATVPRLMLLGLVRDPSQDLALVFVTLAQGVTEVSQFTVDFI